MFRLSLIHNDVKIFKVARVNVCNGKGEVMTENIKSQLFFLKQFGFSENLLTLIYELGINPLHAIFNHDYENLDLIKDTFTPRDKELSQQVNEFNKLVIDLLNTDPFLKKNKRSKIFFKYDKNNFTNLLPKSIMPFFMYAKGNISLLDNDRERISIIGTRKPSENSIKITQHFTRKFTSEGYIIVSGLAEGIDSASHRTALEYGGETIAILPTNFNKIYPKKNERLAKEIAEKGLLLTSIGPKENTYKTSFLERNKYVANISDLLFVVETNLKSGTMNTIRNANESGKKILFIDQKDKEINDRIIKFGGEMIDISY